jgi:hypothetical protein
MVLYVSKWVSALAQRRSDGKMNEKTTHDGCSSWAQTGRYYM